MVGMAWLSRISADTSYFPQIALPMLLLGLGIGTALIPLTTAGMAGVEPKDAGAASGVTNVAQQLGSSLGLGILVTVFAAASRSAAHHPVGVTVRLQAQQQLAHGVATSLKGSAIFLSLALAVVFFVMRPRRSASTESLPAESGAMAHKGDAVSSLVFPPRRSVVLAEETSVDLDERKCS
jgi:hypothetical protein